MLLGYVYYVFYKIYCVILINYSLIYTPIITYPFLMGKFCVFIAISAILLLGVDINVRAQAPDTAMNSSVIADPAAFYHQFIGRSSGLYSGIEYKYHSPEIVGLPFFLNNNWNRGTVVYNKVLYENVAIRYDAVDDNLVALLFNQALPYVLNREKVQSFDLLNHHFVYVEADTLQKGYNVKSGFYEQLYSGKTEVLLKQSKTIETYSSVSQSEIKYVDKISVYLKNKTNYYPVSGNSSIINALQDKKKDIQQYIKSNHIRVKKNALDGLVQIAAYYDTLTK